MKVCMMVFNTFTNDARVKREATALIEEGFDVTVFAIFSKNLNIKENIEGINVHRLKKQFRHVKLFLIGFIILTIVSWFLSVYLFSLFCLFLIFYKYFLKFILFLFVVFKMIYYGVKHYDIYHAHDLNTLFQCLVCAKLRRKKCIYDSHEVQSSRNGYNKFIAKVLEKILIHFIDEMIMTTETRANYTYKLYGIKPVVIHNYSVYIDYDEIEAINFYERYQIDKNKKILLYQGGIQRGRGLRELVLAMQYVEKGHLVIIGQSYKGELQALRNIVYDFNLDHKVTFIDKVPLNELPKYTKSAYVGFQLLQNTNFNHYSALSNKLFEYMMMHVPVISCNLVEIKKVVSDNEIGLVVDSTNVYEISDAINKLISEPEIHARFVNHCKRAKLIYNWNNERIRFLEVYERLLKN